MIKENGGGIAITPGICTLSEYKSAFKRKLGERPFGNIEARRSKCYYKTPESKLKGAILIACKYNIIAYFKNKAWCASLLSFKTPAAEK
ncbi:MAG: hypothetical protein N2V78_06355 [Methanophagales archaeon]|nr:hypothetical protein [Methanophagales archaeon]